MASGLLATALVSGALTGCDQRAVDEGGFAEPAASDSRAIHEITQPLEAALCGSMAGLQANSPWPMRGGCPTHAAQSSEYGAEANQQNWQRSVTGIMQGSAVQAADGSIYMGTESGQLHKLDPATGTILRTLNIGGGVRGTPAIAADGTIYIGSDNWKMNAVNPATFALKWSYQGLGRFGSSPAVGADGTVYVGSEDFVLYALNPSNGAKKWSYRSGGGFQGAPAVGADGTIYIGGLDWYVYAIRPNGTLKWRKGLDFGIQASPAIGRDGRLYIAAANYLYALDTANGSILWKKSLGCDFVASPAIGANGVVYVGTGSLITGAGSVQAFTPEGELLWTYTQLGYVESTPSIDRAGNLYVGSNDGNVYALDAAGDLIWKFAAGAKVQSMPLIARGGAIVFGSFNKYIYSVGAGRARVPAGGQCTTDSACDSGLVCGRGVGARFGLSASANLCWAPSCENEIQDPGETEVDCGGGCGSCTGACGAACTLGAQVSGPALEVLAFSKGSFSRPSRATYHVGEESLEYAAADQLRMEDLGDGNGRLALFEGARVNRVLHAEDLGQQPPWTPSTVAARIALNEDVADAPDGNPSADQLIAPTAGYPSPRQTIPAPIAPSVLSAWVRLTDPSDTSASTRLLLVDSTNRAYSSPETWVVSGHWERRALRTSASTCAADVLFSHKGAWPGSIDLYPPLGAADFLAWGLQLEEGNVPSSYIPTGATPQRRSADRLRYEASVVPAWIRSGTWQFDVAPTFASASLADGDEFVLVAWEGGRISLRKGASAGALKISGVSTSAERPIEWGQDDRLTLTVNTVSRTIDVRGVSSGQGQLSYPSAIAVPATSALSLGAQLDGTNAAFSRLSEIRRVNSASVACTPDPDCTTCGDGIVSATEACDRALTALCLDDCSGVPLEPIPCDPSDATACGGGQVCGANNGPAFGGSWYESYCWPATTCGGPGPVDCGPDRPCGRCFCTVDCATVTCGQSIDPACVSDCLATCEDGQAGCVSNADCGGTSTCMAGVCRPERCMDEATRKQECGPPPAACGPCLVAQIGSKCEVQECGVDEFGVSCGECGDGSVCQAGNCRALGNAPPVEATDLADASTSSAGALDGAIDVDLQGNATYSVPIDLPPGRAGVQPDLSIQYNSGGLRTHVGDGWSLGGQMVISRCSRQFANDGYSESVQFTQDDRFCLNGQYLLLVSRSELEFPPQYGDIDTEYRTEPDSHLRVFARRETEVDVSGYVEPEFFEAKDNNGTTYRFGKTQDSRKWADSMRRSGQAELTLQWYLNEVEDMNGNSVKYSYLQGAVYPLEAGRSFVQEVMLARIDYPPYHHVEFEYKRVPNARWTAQRFRAGVEANITQRLVGVRTFAGAKPVLHYELATDIEHNAWRLKSVAKCAAGDPEVCLEPITFEYNDPEYKTLVDTRLSAGEVPKGEDKKATKNVALFHSMSIDINHDGRDDLFYTVFRDDYKSKIGYERLRWVFRTSDGRGGFSPEQPSNLRTDCGIYEALDYNNDGYRDDVFQFCGFRNEGVYAAVHQGSGQFTYTLLEPLPENYPGPNGPEMEGRALLADLEGDGVKELLTCNMYSTGLRNVAYWHVQKRQANGEWSGGILVVQAWGNYCGFDTMHRVSDLDGDGAEEVTLHMTDTENPLTWGTITWSDDGPTFVENYPFGPAANLYQYGYHLDINGDNLMDAVMPYREGLGIAVNAGNGEFRSAGKVLKPDWYSADAADSAFVADVDADGRDEFYLPIKKSGKYAVLSPRTDSEAEETDLDYARRFSLGLMDYSFVAKDWQRPLTLVSGPEGQKSVLMRAGRRTNVTWQKLEANPRSVNKLRRVRAAGQQITDISYDVAGQEAAFSPVLGACGPTGVTPADNTFNCPGSTPSPVVSELFEEAGVVSKKSLFRYEGLRVDRLRGLSVGFSKMSRIDSNLADEADRWASTTFDNTTRAPAGTGIVIYANQPQTREVTHVVEHPGRDAVSVHSEKTTMSWSHRLSDKNVVFPFLGSSRLEVSENFQIVSSVENTSSLMDAWGNAWGSRVEWSDGRVVEHSTFYDPAIVGVSYPEAETKNLRSLPWLEVLSASQAGASERVVTKTLFDGLGRPTDIISLDTDSTSPGLPASSLPERSRVVRTYRPFGNLESETRSASDAVTQSSEYIYDETETYLRELHTGLHDDLGIAASQVWVDEATGTTRWSMGPAGDTQTLNLDGFGRIREQITSGGVRKTTEYITNGVSGAEILAVRESGAGMPTRTVYHMAGGRVSRTREARPGSRDVLQNYRYDRLGRVSGISVPYFAGYSGDFALYSYDSLDRVTRVITPFTDASGNSAGATTTYDYLPRALLAPSEVPNLAAVAPQFTDVQITKDPEDRTHYVLFDLRGNTVGSIDPTNTPTRNDYDVFDRLRGATTGTAPNAASTVIEYNSSGRITHVSDPDTGSDDYVYDGLGLLRSATRNDETTRYDWDGLGRLTVVTAPDGTIRYDWDTDTTSDPTFAGRLWRQTKTSPDGETSYRYRYEGPDGAISTETVTVAGAEDTIGYDYGAGALVTGIRWPSGVAASYVRDSSGRITEVRDPAQPASAPALWKASAWDVYGEVVDRTFGPGFTLHADMDPATGRATNLATTGILSGVSQRYTYDARGSMRSRTRGSVVETYTPDAAGRIDLYERRQGIQLQASVDFGYDPIGNLKSAVRTGDPSIPNLGTLTYDNTNKPHAVRSSADGRGYDYDVHGNQTLRTGSDVPGGQQNLVYSSFGLPRRITTGPAAAPIDTTNFVYGPDGRRLRKQRVGGAVVRSSVPNYLQTVAGATTTTRVSIPLPDGSSVQRTSTGATSSTAFLIADPQGSIIAVIAQGQAQAISYTPFGLASGPGVNATSWGFAGAENDDAEQLINMKARLYDAKLGQFLSPDPIAGDPLWGAQGLSPYAYAFNAPQALTDPSGLSPCGSPYDGFDTPCVLWDDFEDDYVFSSRGRANWVERVRDDDWSWLGWGSQDRAFDSRSAAGWGRDSGRDSLSSQAALAASANIAPIPAPILGPGAAEAIKGGIRSALSALRVNPFTAAFTLLVGTIVSPIDGKSDPSKNVVVIKNRYPDDPQKTLQLYEFTARWNGEILKQPTRAMEVRGGLGVWRQRGSRTSERWRRQVRADNPNRFPPGSTVDVAHIPDEVWGGQAAGGAWMPLDRGLNRSIGAQAKGYLPGYRYHRVLIAPNFAMFQNLVEIMTGQKRPF